MMAFRGLEKVPSGWTVRKLGCIERVDAVSLLESELRSLKKNIPVEDICDRLGGHPGLLATAIEIGRGKKQAKTFFCDLGSRLRAQWVEPLSPAMRRASAMLAAAGGWLPLTLDVKGFQRAASDLVRDGLADLDDGAVVVSPLLLAAKNDQLGRAVLISMVEALRGQKPIEPSGVRLAEANLLQRLGEDDLALSSLRGAYRFMRGTPRKGWFERSIMWLQSEEPSALGDAARLAWEVRRTGLYGQPEASAEKVRKLLERGSLESEEVLEARAFLAFLKMRKGEGEEAFQDLEGVVEDAVRLGDPHGEAQALLWQALLCCIGDEQRLAGAKASRAMRVARRTGVPALHARALFFMGRCDLLEGDWEAASRRLEQSLRLCRRHRLEDDQVVVLDALAGLASHIGRPSEAAEHLALADVLAGRSGVPSRRAELAVTRAEVALKRGHVTESREILEAADRILLSQVGDVWRRDLVAAEAALAADDIAGAKRELAEMTPPPAISKSWRRRKAFVAACLLEEGVKPEVDLEECLEDPLAELCLRRAGGDREGALRAILEVEKGLSDDDLEGWVFLRSESSRLRFMDGRIEEGTSDLRDLRQRLVRGSPPTSVVLFIEAIEHLARGELLAAARCSAASLRFARRLGYKRMAAYALECLLLSHLIEGRSRGVRSLLARGQRMVAECGSPARAARFATYKVVSAIRFGESPEPKDVLAARRSKDPLVVELADLVLGKPRERGRSGEAGPGRSLAVWFRSMALTGASETASLGGMEGPATELRIDGERREVVLAGGKRISFARRRVLWRLLWKLLEAKGRATDPSSLYCYAWELPFNASRLNSLYVGVRRLRLLVEPDPSSPRIILAAEGGGYAMDIRRVEVVGHSPLG